MGYKEELLGRCMEYMADYEEIVTKQAKIINELLVLLSSHISAEELQALPVIESINEAAMIRAEIGF